MPDDEYCPICGTGTHHLFHQLMMGRHQAAFVRCPECGFVRCKDPRWLSEAYVDAIASTDVGLVARNLEVARLVSVLCRWRLGSTAKVIDVAGGTGLLVRLLRDYGIDARWRDPHCTNTFAAGAEAAGDDAADLVTMIEVIEHVHDPVSFIADVVASHRPRLVALTTSLIPEPTPVPGSWDYYAEETGQHIAFHTTRSLARLAARHGWRLQRLGLLWILGPEGIVPRWLRAFADRRMDGILCSFRRPGSGLLETDARSSRARLRR